MERDGVFIYKKNRGSYVSVASRKGTVNFGPQDRTPTVCIRSAPGPNRYSLVVVGYRFDGLDYQVIAIDPQA